MPGIIYPTIFSLFVPAQIASRTPNPDIIPGVEDKYFDLFGIPSPVMDLILWGLEHGTAPEEIARQLTLAPDKVSEIREIVELTAHMRNPSQTMRLEKLM